MDDMWQQNPELTAYLKHMEAERTRAYLAATMRWSCRRPVETVTEYTVRKLSEGVIPADVIRSL